MYDPAIHRRKTAVMQRIQQLSVRGYRWYIRGEVRADRALNMAAKFAEKYGVGMNENQRSYAKRKGKANAFLLMYPKKNESAFLWWLLATDGDGRIHQEEHLISVTDQHHRLTWSGDYELVMLTREGKNKPVMTWRMTREGYRSWHERLRKAVRARTTNEQVKQAIWTLFRAPGFSEVRKQVKQLAFQLQKEWQRTRKEKDDMPPIPANIGYVRGFKSDTIPLSVIVRRMKLGKRPFPRADAKVA